MGRVKDQWIADVELCEDKFMEGKISEAEFREEMKQLGFDDHEIDEKIVDLPS